MSGIRVRTRRKLLPRSPVSASGRSSGSPASQWTDGRDGDRAFCEEILRQSDERWGDYSSSVDPSLRRAACRAEPGVVRRGRDSPG